VSPVPSPPPHPAPAAPKRPRGVPGRGRACPLTERERQSVVSIAMQLEVASAIDRQVDLFGLSVPSPYGEYYAGLAQGICVRAYRRVSL
jgi:hypothetical protein